MPRPTRTAAFALVARATTSGQAQPPPRPGDPNRPAPGPRGNPHNVPFIGRREPMGNPVRQAQATGHGSNSSAEKVRPDTLPDPLVLASGERVADGGRGYQARRPEISCPLTGTVSLTGNGPGLALRPAQTEQTDSI